jgi:hypothetical protein
MLLQCSSEGTRLCIRSCSPVTLPVTPQSLFQWLWMPLSCRRKRANQVFTSSRCSKSHDIQKVSLHFLRPFTSNRTNLQGKLNFCNHNLKNYKNGPKWLCLHLGAYWFSSKNICQGRLVGVVQAKLPFQPEQVLWAERFVCFPQHFHCLIATNFLTARAINWLTYFINFSMQAWENPFHVLILTVSHYDSDKQVGSAKGTTAWSTIQR